MSRIRDWQTVATQCILQNVLPLSCIEDERQPLLDGLKREGVNVMRTWGFSLGKGQTPELRAMRLHLVGMHA
jgi:hypothetical protein